MARYFQAVTLTLDLVSRIPMTSQDLQEPERVQIEWYAARDAFEKAVQDGESLAEIDEALNRSGCLSIASRKVAISICE